jgi:hypothetical protein
VSYYTDHDPLPGGHRSARSFTTPTTCEAVGGEPGCEAEVAGPDRLGQTGARCQTCRIAQSQRARDARRAQLNTEETS